MTCPDCRGAGLLCALVDAPKVRGLRHITCQRCKGSGEINPTAEFWTGIGGMHRTWRVAQHEGLAACAERLGLDVRDLNDMEHGLADPATLLTDIPDVLRATLPRVPNQAA